MKPNKIAVLGGGSWGTTTASVISRNCETMLWARNERIVASINNERCNPLYLGNSELNPKLTATHRIEEAVRDAKAVLVAVPSSHFRQVLTRAVSIIAKSVPIIRIEFGIL